MGLEVALPLLLEGLSAGASYYNTEQTQKKQDNALSAELAQQQVRQDQANAQTNQLIQKQAASNPKQFQESALNQYQTQLAKNQAVAAASVPSTPGASSTYQDAGKNAALGIGDYGTKVASLMSRIDAPVAQRQQEAFNAGDTGAKLQQISNFAQGDNFLSQLRLQAIRRNAGLDAFAGLLKGAASAYGGGMGGAPDNPLNGSQTFSSGGGMTSNYPVFSSGLGGYP